MKQNIYLLIVWLLTNTSVQGAVQLSQTEKMVTIDNSIITATFNKTNARMLSLQYNNQELLSNGGVGYFQMYSHEGFAGPKETVFSISKQQKGLVDLSFKQSNEHFPFTVDIHYVIRDGFSGLYNYVVVEYDPKRHNEVQLHQLNLALRLDPELFTHAQIEDDLYGKMPTLEEMKAGEKVMDATYRLADGSVYTKYDWSVHEENHLAHGVMGDGLGAWILQPDREHLNGGPFAQELSLHQTHSTPILLRHFTAAHFGSGIISLNASIGHWKKIGGPWVIYINSEDSHEKMWEDAKAETQKQLDQWPFQWLDHEIYPLERVTVKGQIKNAGDALVVLNTELVGQQPEIQRNGKGYYFWTRADPSGHFEINNVRPGTYRLVAIKAGVFGEFSRGNIDAPAETTTDLGAMTWDHPSIKGKLLWQIGTPDRSAGEFMHGDDYRHWGMINDYPKEFPEDVHFEIGKSNIRTDWNYVQPSYKDESGQWQLPTWKISFDLLAAPQGQACLTLGFAGATTHANDRDSLAGVAVYLNGKQLALVQSLINDSGASRSGIRGLYRQRQIKFNGDTLIQGTNLLELKLAPSHQATGIKHDFPYTTIMYDSIRLKIYETPKAVPDPELKIAVLGDSTVTQQNWGTLMSNHYSSSLTFENYAKCGESSKSFIMNGYWDQALKSNAHFFLIQFGHNDCPNKGNRTTDPQTTYKFYLQKYIDDIKALGSQAILVTPMERRIFNTHGKIKPTLDTYAQAMKEVAQANQVPVIDLHGQSIALYEKLGKEKSDSLGPKGDRTHFNLAGAEQITHIVIKLLDDIDFLSTQRLKSPSQEI